MALPSPSRTPRQDPCPHCSPPAEGGSVNGARAYVALKTKEVEDMLVNLEEEGVEMDGKIASIIDDEITRIKDESTRVNVQKRNGLVILITISSVVVGFLMGAECWEQSLYGQLAKRILNGE